MPDRRTPFGYAIFCDDIRQEQGGKVSLMGVYSSKALIDGEFPYTIAKLCIAVNFVLGPDDGREDVNIQVLTVGDQGQPELVIEGLMPGPSFKSGNAYVRGVAHIELAPVELSQPCKMVVQAIYGSKLYPVGTLKFVSRSGDPSTRSEDDRADRDMAPAKPPPTKRIAKSRSK